MTDTSTAKLPTEHALVQVCRYKAGPPLDLVEPGDTFATTKEEEWVSKKKTELTTTRQIETRVKRQVVLEDGKVVDDSGPIVTTNTHEDTEKQEHSQTELRKLGEDEPEQAAAIEGAPTDGVTLRDWVAVPNSDGVVKEVKGHRVVTREETEERRETEDVQHLGDITDEDFLAAVHSGKSDLREVLKDNGTNIVSIGPRVVHESIKTKKTTDTEDTANVSSVTPDGKLVTETKKTTEHEEVKDEELPEDEPDSNAIKENSQRYLKTKDQEFVEYLADGVKIGQEMRYKAETMEGERHGDPEDPADWDSLSTRIRRTNRRQQVAGRVQIQKPKGIEEPQIGPVVDRKDALTKKPLDFDAEEETRKAETSKWLENHFGSESTRSSRDSLDQITEAPTTTKSFFSVTIKSAPTRVEQVRPFVAATTTRVYSPSPEPVQVTPIRNGYYQGITEWSDRKHVEILKPHAPYPIYPTDRPHAIQSPYHHLHEPVGVTPTPPERKRLIERRQRSSQDSNRYDSGYRTHSRNEMSRTSVEEPAEEPPPDYSPPPPSPSPPGVHQVPKKPYQRTRFATDTVKAKPSGNIIGQSIRKLVGKIRSVSAERKAKQRAKRSPSPQTTYQQYNVIDNNIPSSTSRRSRDSDASMTDRKSRNSPVQKYYLGEDPFGGSIYGRENKYDGVRPARAGRPRPHRRESNPSEDEQRSHSTLGRFSKSASRLGNGDTRDYSRSVQTLPRNSESTRRRSPPHNNAPNTINVSIINTVGGSRPLANGGPAKPARTYKSHLARSKSFNVHTTSTEGNLYKSNPQLHRLDEHPIGLKSPAIVSLISRSTKDLSDEKPYQNRIRDTRSFKPDARNQTVDRSRFNQSDTQKKTFLKGLKERAPDLYKTLNSDDEDPRKPWHPQTFSTPVKHSHYNQNIYEPPTRLIDPYPVIRRGSNSTDDYSETYHTTTRSDDPKRPSVTDTVKIISKKTIPAKDGRKLQTIESTETKSITRSRMRGEPTLNGSKMNNGGVVIEVKNYRN